MFFAFDFVADIPFELYSSFVIEERFGFNKLDLKTFVADKLKALLLTAVLGTPLLLAVVYVCTHYAERLHIYLSVLLFVFQILIASIFFPVIAPLFNTYTPLEDGELRNEVEKLCSSQKYRLQKVFVVDGSKRSSHSNAFFFGMACCKRLVIYDSLLEKDGKKTPLKHVMPILGHELSHWKNSHTSKLMALQMVLMVGVFWVLGQCLNGPQAHLEQMQ